MRLRHGSSLLAESEIRPSVFRRETAHDSNYGSLSRFVDDRVRKRADLLDLDAAGVAWLEKDFGFAGHADAVGSTRENDRPRQKRGAAREKLN